MKNCPFKFNMNLQWWKELKEYGIDQPELLLCDEEECAIWYSDGRRCGMIQKDF